MMKIGQPSDHSPAVVQTGQAALSKAGQSIAPASKSDRQPAGIGVTVSDLARKLEQTRGADAPEVDMDKVNAVRQAIEQKTFRVNPEAIADKLLANAREMLNRSRT